MKKDEEILDLIKWVAGRAWMQRNLAGVCFSEGRQMQGLLHDYCRHEVLAILRELTRLYRGWQEK